VKLVVVISVLCGAVSVFAQEPPLPSATETPAASPSVSVRPKLDIPEIPLTVEPTPLVPNTAPVPSKKSLPSISELDAQFPHTSLGQAVEEQKLHIEWRKLKNRVSLDPEVVAANKAIATAQTDVEKRDLLRAYYKIFYARMQALAETPEVKNYLEQKKQAALAGLVQPHVRPEPTPRPTPKR
jgi:hypothetical protein